MSWMPDAERKLRNLENEPIGADPITIKKQIEHLKVRGHQTCQPVAYFVRFFIENTPVRFFPIKYNLKFKNSCK